jgi:hypothetical protein
MAKAFDRESLLAALDEVGEAAITAGVTLEIAVYGGSALMLASNFRFASEDVDLAILNGGWPEWLSEVARMIAARNGWAEDWLNDAVTFHLSPAATASADHVAFGTFPRRQADGGLRVFVPTAEYMLALKLKAIRVNDPARGEQEARDILNLSRAMGLQTPEEALAALARYFPKSAEDADKQRFLLKHIWNKEAHHAPRYAR